MITLINLWEQTITGFKEKAKRLAELMVSERVRIHIDAQELGFGNTQTIFPEEWVETPENVKIDVHLMVNQPEAWIERVCGKPGVVRVIGQIEKIDNIKEWEVVCIAKNLEAGVCVDFNTGAMSVREQLKLLVDHYSGKDRPQILLMGYPAGILNQTFNTSVIDKVRAVRDMVGNRAEIIVDGGVNYDNAVLCREAGADGVAVYSYIWKNFPEHYLQLKAIK